MPLRHWWLAATQRTSVTQQSWLCKRCTQARQEKSSRRWCNLPNGEKLNREENLEDCVSDVGGMRSSVLRRPSTTTSVVRRKAPSNATEPGGTGSPILSPGQREAHHAR